MIYWLAPSGLVSFTGGEPLLQARYIARLIKRLGAKYTYLIETNGTLPGALKFLAAPLGALQKNIIYSVDLKKNNPQFLRFYQNIPKMSPRYLKIILGKNPKPLHLDISQTLEILLKTDSEVYLQAVDNRFDKKLLQKWLFVLDKNGRRFKVTPQIHKLLRLK
jgi:organic radical activating enzyme